jgi:hypothetical protein
MLTVPISVPEDSLETPRFRLAANIVPFVSVSFVVIYRLSCMVPGGGLEPPRPCGLRILSPLRLPISPSGHCRLGGCDRGLNSVSPPSGLTTQEAWCQFWCQLPCSVLSQYCIDAGPLPIDVPELGSRIAS